MRPATVYRDGEPHTTAHTTEWEAAIGVTDAQCRACRGTGEFVITDDHSDSCVPCSGTGYVGVSL